MLFSFYKNKIHLPDLSKYFLVGIKYYLLLFAVQFVQKNRK